MKQPLGMKYQDKYGLAGTKLSDYVIDKGGNVKRDTAGFPVKRINSYFTADIKRDLTIHQIDEEDTDGSTS